MNTKDKIEFAWKILQHNQDMIKFADSKVRFLLIVSGISTSYILVNLADFFSFPFLKQFMIGVFLVSFFFFLIFALLTIVPRYSTIIPSKMVPDVVFYQNIAERSSAEDYITDYSKSKEEDILRDVLNQVYVVSKIASDKFKYNFRSWICLGIQLISFIMIMTIKMF